MKSAVQILIVALLLVLPWQSAWAQVEVTTLREMITLKNPSSKKIYRVSDVGKQGDWQYDAEDKKSEPNVGTILSSANRTVTGRFKRLFDYEDGVNIDWFLSSVTSSSTINEALLLPYLLANGLISAPKSIKLSPSQLRQSNPPIPSG